MGVEIERKFLVNKAIWDKEPKPDGTLYRQAYLLTDPERTIRVRLAGDKGYLTIKGISTGMSRPEFEYEIPESDAKELLGNFCGPDVSKTRFKVKHEDRLWEVDEFLGDNAGLIVAELELSDQNESFGLPRWIQNEVTGDARYFNASLSVNPFKSWKGGL